MIYHSNQADHYLWKLILRGKLKAKKNKKTTEHPNKKFLLFSMVGFKKKSLQFFVLFYQISWIREFLSCRSVCNLNFTSNAV